MAAINPDRQRLAQRLRELRAATGLSSQRFGSEKLGWSQTRTSRVERGAQLPTDQDLADWAAGVDASQETLAELREMLRRARVEYVTHRDSYRAAGSAAADQDRIAERQTRASRIRHYQPAVIAGVLQTAEYMREFLTLPCGPAHAGATAEKIEDMVAARIKRQEILYQTGRQLQFIIGETALRTPPRTTDALLGQLDRLASVAGLSSVEVGIGPLGEPMRAYPLSGFVIYDDDFVTIETLTAEHIVSDEEEVKVYVAAFEELRAGAVIGPDSVDLIRRVMADFVAHQGSKN